MDIIFSTFACFLMVSTILPSWPLLKITLKKRKLREKCLKYSYSEVVIVAYLKVKLLFLPQDLHNVAFKESQMVSI